MDWQKYFAEKDDRKRWDMLAAYDRLSYDHVDSWLRAVRDDERRRIIERMLEAWDRIKRRRYVNGGSIFLDKAFLDMKEGIEKERDDTRT